MEKACAACSVHRLEGGVLVCKRARVPAQCTHCTPWHGATHWNVAVLLTELEIYVEMFLSLQIGVEWVFGLADPVLTAHMECLDLGSTCVF